MKPRTNFDISTFHNLLEIYIKEQSLNSYDVNLVIDLAVLTAALVE